MAFSPCRGLLALAPLGGAAVFRCEDCASDRRRRAPRVFAHPLGAVAASHCEEGAQHRSPRASHTFVPREGAEHLAVPAVLRLQRVVAVCRHGDRSPIDPVKAGRSIGAEAHEPFWIALLPEPRDTAAWEEAHPRHLFRGELASAGRPPAFWDEGGNPSRAQLTWQGAGECEVIGHALSQRYCLPFDFVSHPRRVLAISTNTMRTVHSAQNILRGLFALQGGIAPGKVPVFVRARCAETLVPNADSTNKRLLNELGRVKGERAPEFAKRYGGLETRLRHAIGLEADVVFPWAVVREVVTCHELYNLPLPPAFDSATIEQLMDANALLWGDWYRDFEVRRLAAGRLVNQIHGFFAEFCGDHTAPVSFAGSEAKLMILIAHDASLVPLLCFLECYSDKWPPYASTLLLELAEEIGTKNSWVRVVLNDEVQGCRCDAESALGRLGWMRWQDFATQCASVALDEAAYRALCEVDVASPRTTTEAAASELAATIGTIPSSVMRGDDEPQRARVRSVSTLA